MFRVLWGLLGLISVQAKDYAILYATDPISSLLQNRSNAEDICDGYKLEAYNCSSVTALVYFNGETFSDVTVPLNTAVMTAQGDSFLTRWNRTSVLAADFYAYFGGTPFWTGIGSTGSPLASASCFNWKSNSTLAKGGVGWQKAYSFSSPCNRLYSLLCACYSTSSTLRPTLEPTALPTASPTKTPSKEPTRSPTRLPSKTPTTTSPSRAPSTTQPSSAPTYPIPITYISRPSDQTQEISLVTAIAAGDGFTCVMHNMHDTYCWGKNDVNQAPAFVDGGHISGRYLFLAAGPRHVCRGKRVGLIECWGELPGSSDRNRGEGVYRTEPGEIVTLWIPDYGEISKLEATETVTCVLTSSGKIYCWGKCGSDQCGTGSGVSAYDTLRTVNSGPQFFVDFAVTKTVLCAIICTTAIFQTGFDPSKDAAPPCRYHGLDCRGTPSERILIMELAFYVVGMTGGSDHMCMKTTMNTGQVSSFCWGDNTVWQLGSQAIASHGILITDTTTFFAGNGLVKAGARHTCRVEYLTLKQGGRIWCWGANESGQLGQGTNSVRAIAAKIAAKPGYTEKHNILAFGIGNTHTCVVFDIGRVRCWGSNTYGELGDGTRTATNVMTPIITTAYLTMNEASSMISFRYFPPNIDGYFLYGEGLTFEWAQKFCHMVASPFKGVFRVFPFLGPDNYTLLDIVGSETVRTYNLNHQYINYFGNVLKGILPVAINPNKTTLSFVRTNMNTVGGSTGGCYWNKLNHIEGMKGVVFSDFNAASSPPLTIVETTKCNQYRDVMCMIQHYENAFTPEGNFRNV